MNKIKALLVIAIVAGGVLPLMAQQKRVSPHETVSAVVDGNRITVTYGRPYVKNPRTGEPRKIWGGLVPYGKIWRTGADEATVFTTQKTLVLGGATIPAGTYTLWTLPAADGSAKLIFNKQVGQWGVGPGSYDEKQDVARVDLKKTPLDQPVEQFTMAISKAETGGVIKLSWENTEFSVPFTVQP